MFRAPDPGTAGVVRGALLTTDAYIEGMFEAWQRGPGSVHMVCACVCARARVGEGGRDGLFSEIGLCMA